MICVMTVKKRIVYLIKLKVRKRTILTSSPFLNTKYEWRLKDEKRIPDGL